jgi:P-type Ca2+ transporter type 2C
VHIPIAGLALAPLLLGWPIILGPMHIATLEMIIDPVCALAFEVEKEEPGIMRRPPRDPKGSLIPRVLLAWAAIQGVAASIALFALAAWAFGSPGMETAEARATVFVAMVVAVLVLVGVNRTFAGPARPRLRRNVPFLAIALAAAVFMALVLAVPTLSSAFGLAPPPARGLAAILAVAIALPAILLTLRPRFGAALAH